MTGKRKNSKSTVKTEKLKVKKDTTVKNVKKKKSLGLKYTDFILNQTEDSLTYTQETWEWMNE